MKKLRFLIILLIVTVTVFSSKANNVRITNVSLVDVTTLRFNISWENSWYTTVPPQNHDAVWIFCKRSYCPNPVIWTQADVSTTISDHFAGSPLEVYLDGKNAAGIFVRRSAPGFGNIDNVEVRIKLSMPSSPGEYDYRIFAIEMVQISEGAFYLGDGTTGINNPGNPVSYGSFFEGNTANMPYQVTSGSVIPVGTGSGQLTATGWIPPSNIPATYPNGYDAFYCMKYEVTSGQMAAFLNHNNQAMHNRWIGLFAQNEALVGQTVTNSTWQSVTIQYPWRAVYLNGGCSYDAPSVAFSLAYLDWAGLRPMTEMEFEKICRGPDYPVAGEFAWGNNVIYNFNPSSPEAVSYGTPNETHNVTFSGFTQGIALFGSRVYRVGFAAKPGSSRIQSGSAYWGVMEMSAHVSEGVVSAASASALNYLGTPGDGVLDVQGYFNTPDWPAFGPCGANTNYIARGGEFYSGGGPRHYVSSRYVYIHGASDGGSATVQFRGAR